MIAKLARDARGWFEYYHQQAAMYEYNGWPVDDHLRDIDKRTMDAIRAYEEASGVEFVEFPEHA